MKKYSTQRKFFTAVFLLAFFMASYASTAAEENVAGQRAAEEITPPISTTSPQPHSEINFVKCPGDVDVGKEYEIIMELVNKGPASLKDKNAFCGMHIETENAHVKNVLGYAAFADVRETKVMRAKTIEWFEVLYNALGKDEKASVRFQIIPSRLPVKIWYRAWIPQEVPEEKKGEATAGLIDRYKATGYWRHENFIIRLPKNDDASAPFCRVRVKAAHKEKQDYRCFVKKLPSFKSNKTKPLIKNAEKEKREVGIVETGAVGIKNVDRGKATIEELERLGPDEKKFLLKVAREAIKLAIQKKQMERPRDVPKTLTRYANTVYVTVYEDGRVRGCQGRARADLVDSTIAASHGILSDRRFHISPGPGSSGWMDDILIDINILAKRKGVKGRDINSLKKEIVLGIDGIQIKHGKRTALYKDSVAITSNMSHRKLIETLCKKAGLKKDAWRKKEARIYKFRSVDFIETKDDRGYIDLFRAMPYVNLTEVTRKKCEDAMTAGSEWLARNQIEDGSYSYQYYPSRDSYDSGDNIIRQAGCAYSMALIGRAADDERFTGSARKAIDYVLTKVKFLKDDLTLPYVYDGKAGTLGGNALLLLAMVELRDSSPYRPMMDKLVNSILYMQGKDGGFKTFYEPLGTKGGDDFFPGEALLALIRYYERIEKSERCVNAIRAAYLYYFEYWRKNRIDIFVPWQSQAWSRAYAATGDRRYADFAWEMSDHVLQRQYTDKRLPFKDYLGGFGGGMKPPRFDSCVYAEGIAEAFHVARMMNDDARVLKYGKALSLSTRFILSLQFNKKNMYYIRNKPAVEGGFRMSLTNNSMRCDYTQHAIVALCKILENFQGGDFKRFTEH